VLTTCPASVTTPQVPYRRCLILAAPAIGFAKSGQAGLGSRSVLQTVGPPTTSSWALMKRSIRSMVGAVTRIRSVRYGTATDPLLCSKQHARSIDPILVWSDRFAASVLKPTICLLLRRNGPFRALEPTLTKYGVWTAHVLSQGLGTSRVVVWDRHVIPGLTELAQLAHCLAKACPISGPDLRGLMTFQGGAVARAALT
jgi:hypothetical protein